MTLFNLFTFQVSLWGNKFDLSISSGEVVQHSTTPLQLAQKLHNCILKDESKAIFDHILNVKHVKSNPRRVDFVLDNAGLELFGDLCFAEYLISTGVFDVAGT